MFPELLVALVTAAIIGALAVHLFNRLAIRSLERGNAELRHRITNEILKSGDLNEQLRVLHTAEQKRRDQVRAGAARATEARKASAAARRLLKSHQ